MEGIVAPACISSANRVSMGAGRSAKYFFTSGAPTTLPIPIPNNARAERTRKSGTLSTSARNPEPAAAASIATTAANSRLVRRINTGVRKPAAPKNKVGSIPSRVAPAVPMPRSAWICGRNGDMPVIAYRRDMPSRAIPAINMIRPRHNDLTGASESPGPGGAAWSGPGAVSSGPACWPDPGPV